MSQVFKISKFRYKKNNFRLPSMFASNSTGHVDAFASELKSSSGTISEHQ
jgi:hypothetical protein